jgi:RecJ-like exonuclease
MDDPVQLPENLLVRFRKAAEALSGASAVRLISHDDADGICSATVLCATMQRMGKRFQCTLLRSFEESALAGADKDHDLVITSDMGSTRIAFLEALKCKVIVLDHHRPERDSEKLLHLNTHPFGIDGAADACASSLAMLFASVCNERNWDMLEVAFAGIIGDRQHLRGLGGVNLYLYQQGRTRGIVDERPGMLLSEGGVRDALFRSTDPFIVGVSGDVEGTAALMQEASLLDSMELQTMDDEALHKLNSLAVLRLLKQGRDYDSIEEGMPSRYYFPGNDRYAHELASLANACGRSDAPALGIQLCLGNPKAREEACRLRDAHAEAVLQAALVLHKKGFVTGEHIQYFVSPSQDLSSDLCGLAMQWLADSSRPTFSLSQKGGEIRISARGTKKLVHKGLDLGTAMREAAGSVGGNGGGHDIASGGKIAQGKEDAFLAALDKVVGTQLKK